MTIYIFGRTNS